MKAGDLVRGEKRSKHLGLPLLQVCQIHGLSIQSTHESGPAQNHKFIENILSVFSRILKNTWLYVTSQYQR